MSSELPPAEHDRLYVLQHTTLKGVQAMSLLSIPFLLFGAYRRKSFALPPLLRRHAAWSFGAGSPIGLGLGWFRMKNEPPERITDRAERLRHNMGQIRTDDYSGIGAVVGALATSAIIRRPLFSAGLPGGASLGIAAGIIVHVLQSLTTQESINPEMMVEEARDGLPLKRVAEEAKGEEDGKER